MIKDKDDITKADRLERKLYPCLPGLEMAFYTGTWCTGVIIALANLYNASTRHASHLHDVEMVKPWWRPGWGPSKRDNDHEWETWKITAREIGLLVVLYPFLSHGVKRFSAGSTLLFSVIYSVMCTVYLLGFLPTLFVFVQIAALYLAFCTGSPVVVWFAAIAYILCLNIYPLSDIKYSLFGDESRYFSGYLTSVLLAWINARCVSFGLDRIWGDVPTEKSHLQCFAKLTAFCFYLPLGIMGPLVTSKTFEDSLTSLPHSLDKKWWLNAFLQSVRYFVWFSVTDISMYFFYQQGLTHRPDLVSSLSMWSLCGMGYMMGQFFQLKYVVMYGTASLIAKLDGVDAPPHPKCIGRIHLYSDMWRYFDTGLHIFMHKYIYQPLVGNCSGVFAKLLSSVVCFSFVYVWHGTLDFILIWSILNFAGIALETVGREVCRSHRYQQWESRTFSPTGVRRFHALVSCPIFIMSALSNFYFFAGRQVGNVFVRKILLESWPKGFPILFAFMYCCAQTSIEVKNLEIKREIMAAKDRNI